jgi:hypothetical protein
MTKDFADLTPMERTAALAGCCAVFLALACSSLLGARPATVACAAFLALVALLLPRLGILMVVFCTPIRSIFDLPQESMQIVLGSGMAAVTLRHLPLLPGFLRERHPRLLVVLAAFIVLFVARTGLELLQHPGEKLLADARETAFYVALLGVALAAYSHAGERGFAAALLTAAGLAVALTMAVDTVDTYFPDAGKAAGLVNDAAGLRFAGLHVNPNATGKYLLFGTLASTAVLLAARSRLAAVMGVVAVVTTALCFSATYSKSTLLAAVGALGVLLLVMCWRRQWRRATALFAVTVLVVVTAGAWYVALAPLADRLALRTVLQARNLPKDGLDRPVPQRPVARQIEDELRIGRSYSMTVGKQQQQPSEPKAESPPGAISGEKAPPEQPPVTAKVEPPSNTPPPGTAKPPPQPVEAEPRAGRSYTMKVERPSDAPSGNSEMYRNIPGRITYTPRDCDWRCTGQRDLLWGSGLDIVAEHWLVGIGPHRWTAEYQARLGFPFDTPHEVWLELWGGYGLAGLALQAVLVFLLAQQVLRCFRTSPGAPGSIFLQATALYMVAMLLAELVDPAQFLAMNPRAIWLWTFAAVQARVLADAHALQEST